MLAENGTVLPRFFHRVFRTTVSLASCSNAPNAPVAELNCKAREVQLELSAVASSRTYLAASSIAKRRDVVPAVGDVGVVRLVRDKELDGDGDVLGRREVWSCGAPAAVVRRLARCLRLRAS